MAASKMSVAIATAGSAPRWNSPFIDINPHMILPSP
jgi:hypothetical protein